MNGYKIQALEIITEWNTKNGEERYNFCRNCVLKAIREGRRLAQGDELGDAVNSTYATVAGKLLDADKLTLNIERRANKGYGDSLPAIVTRAANAAMEGIAYHGSKDSKATSRTITSEDGGEIDVLDTIAAPQNVEESAIFRATLQQFVKGLNETNQKIFTGRIKGLTEREIAPSVGISNIAIHNRMVKIRAELAALL